ncbi:MULTISPECIES: GyrI-like domain-containing protein [Nonomuraea]|uniref:GyrI-like domain-containing protein n=1 Tax=Nonomuraea ferruginea TaxID=46174 RepID=A0ABT4T0L1_9ACTN|nr:MULTISPECIES: GyrI-like domain-containing protein [Nonomuraea]MDA0642581.1 GyrI-like domain-containing protein [Nonomuraea ferruginea]TXK34249.1 GyrI-like domain-containing protein [Nonomuraea sp. C10]
MNHGHDETVAFETVAPQPVISVRRTVPVAELPRTQAEILAALWAHLGEHGVRPAGPPYVRYHAFGDVETDVEVGVPVQGVAASRGEVAMGELPGGPAVTTWHLGAHDRLGGAYDRLQAWTRTAPYKPEGGAWEIYTWIDLAHRPDPAAWPAPSTWRTQLVQPLNSA